MDIDEHLMLKAFDKCFSLLERIDARLNSLEKREFGVDGERLPFLKLGGKIFYKYSEIVKVMQNLRKYDFDKESE